MNDGGFGLRCVEIIFFSHGLHDFRKTVVLFKVKPLDFCLVRHPVQCGRGLAFAFCWGDRSHRAVLEGSYLRKMTSRFFFPSVDTGMHES